MGLTPQQWETIKALFEAAVEKPAVERPSILAAASQDTAVVKEVERLLANHDEAGSFLSSPAGVGAAARDHTPPSFSRGDLLADRFRITRFIARGGMGEVYEAEDVELRERVALKSIRTELLRDPHTVERFRREVHLAKKVTHPNVCRIFDLFRHQASTSGETKLGNSLLLVAMELLQGETLADRLRRESRMRTQEALPIAQQMAAGLGAAHDAGVLHRDFKPGNIVLVPGEKGTRAVITDFGLALRSKEELTQGAPVTGTGQTLGTPAYMSPEQVESKDLTPASDVYSFGLVLYQMITGKTPFDDSTALSMAVRRIKEDPTPPHVLVPDVDPRWERVILHCLQRDPKLRFQNAGEVGRALGGEIAVPHRGRRTLRWLVPAALVLVVMLMLGLRLRSKFTAGNHQPAQTLKARPSAAVLPLKNLSGQADTNWVSTALPDMLTAELAAGEKVRAVPGENIARAMADLGLNGNETLSKDTLDHLRQYLGCDYVVLGSYLVQNSAQSGSQNSVPGSGQDQVRLDLWLQDTHSAEILATVSEKGSERALDDLVTRAGADLRQKLGLGEITAGEAASLRASMPSNPDSARLYSEGLAKMRLFDAAGARDLLSKAAAIDPQSALIHSALADAWSAQGYDDKAREESKKAVDLSAGLARADHLWIEGRYWELNRKWDKAVELYRSLFSFFPDNVDYGLRLAAAQKQARTVDEALSTLAALRQLPPPSSLDPRIDLQQADVYDVKGAYQEQQAAAAAAAARARTLGAKQLLAHALTQQARSLEKQGKPDDALKMAQEAVRISTAAGERIEVAKALTVMGIVRFDQGNFSEAAKVYNQGLVIQRETGDKRGAATTLNNIANALGEQGDLTGSVRMLEESLKMFRDVGDRHSTAAVLGSIAARTIQQGDLSRGRIILQQGLSASREIGDQERTATALYNLGEVLRFQGDLKQARKTYEQALALSKSIGDQSGVAYATFSIGDVLTAQGDLASARQKYNEALNLRNQIGETGTAAETQLALAALSYEEGHAQEAEDMVRKARAEFHKDGSTDDEIAADARLVGILLTQGRAADAQEEIGGEHALLAKSQDFSVQLGASIVAARVQAASGGFDEAIHRLGETIAQAEKSGYAGMALEGKLALGEIEIASGKVIAGKATLAAVRRDAQRKGYGLIASKALRAASAKDIGRPSN
jgi:serine/threonine protein kinase/tetratricopeptide (TPR) repeat protein